MSRILAIDPGTHESGWCVYEAGKVCTSGVWPNEQLLAELPRPPNGQLLAIEMIASYGMAVGKEVFETCVWIGRYQQAWFAPNDVKLVYRGQVKQLLCKSARAKDANIRQALIDMIGPQGTKRAPGPTYGVRSHAWAALAVAVTADAMRNPAAAQPGLFAQPSKPADDEDPFEFKGQGEMLGEAA